MVKSPVTSKFTLGISLPICNQNNPNSCEKIQQPTHSRPLSTEGISSHVKSSGDRLRAGDKRRKKVTGLEIAWKEHVCGQEVKRLFVPCVPKAVAARH